MTYRPIPTRWPWKARIWRAMRRSASIRGRQTRSRSSWRCAMSAPFSRRIGRRPPNRWPPPHNRPQAPLFPASGVERGRNSQVIARKIAIAQARQQGRRDKADHRAGEDVERDCLARPGGGKNRGRDQRRRSAGEYRGELKPDRGAAVAQARREAFGGQRRHNNQTRDRRIKQRVIGKREQAGGRGPKHIDLPAPEPVRQVAGKRDREQRQKRHGEQDRKQEVSRHMDDLEAIGKNKGGVDIDRTHLSHPRESGEDDFPRLTLEYLDHRGARDPFVGNHFLKYRRFQDAEPDPQSDHDHDQAQPEWHPPPPAQKRRARQSAAGQDRKIGQKETGRPAPLRPRGEQSAVLVRSGPLHRQQHRPAPFAADPDPLDETQCNQCDRAPDADRLVGRHAADQKSRQAGQQQRRNQRRLAADAVAVMAEDRSPDRPRGEADGKYGEGLQRADQRLGGRKIQFCKDESGQLAVDEKIVPLDRRSDRTGDHRAAQLAAVLGIGKRNGGNLGRGHQRPPVYGRPLIRSARTFAASFSGFFLEPATIASEPPRQKPLPGASPRAIGAAHSGGGHGEPAIRETANRQPFFPGRAQRPADALRSLPQRLLPAARSFSASARSSGRFTLKNGSTGWPAKATVLSR